jgi:IS30 family transposase
MEQDRWHRAKQIGGSSESGERSKKKSKKKKSKRLAVLPLSSLVIWILFVDWSPEKVMGQKMKQMMR